MESGTKRIIAIVLVAVIVISGIVAVVLLLPTGQTYAWSADDAPGAPSDITKDQIIRIGVIGDTERITGEGSLNGATLAAKEVNEAGGVEVDGETYYFGVTSENTDEANPILDTAVAVTAAKRLVNYKKVQYVTGGFRTESVLAYQPIFMDSDVIFINTGAATPALTQNVLDDYDNFKYFFHPSPQNSSILIESVILGVMWTAFTLSFANSPWATGHNITRFSFMLEDLYWTALFAGAITAALQNNALWNMTATGVAITMPLDVTPIQMEGFWDQVTDANTQIIIPIFSGPPGLTFTMSYGANEPKVLPFGINVMSQDSEYWDDTSGAANYGVTMESVWDTNKTSTTQAFFNDFVDEYGKSPMYTATGSYDAVGSLAWAIEEAQSFDADDIVTALESLTPSDPLMGAGGGVAYTAGHANFFDWPMGIGLNIQWVDGEKVLLPGIGIYPSDPWSTIYGQAPFGTLLNMGTLTIPSWGLYYFD